MRTEEQNENLAKLAKYLLALPPYYGLFDMYDFSKKPFREALPGTCGTVGCAVGHGPVAGIPIGKEDANWYKYSKRFVNDRNEYEWLFAADWIKFDNTHSGAAHRIIVLLEAGQTEEIRTCLSLLHSQGVSKDYFIDEYLKAIAVARQSLVKYGKVKVTITGNWST